MLRSGRRPRTRYERMILNNYHAMQRVGEMRNQPLTPALVCELHRIVTEGTLEDPASVGRFQLPSESRVVVEDNSDGPHIARTSTGQGTSGEASAVCDFANGTISTDAYVPPVIRLIIVHFMLAYDHPFVDGNGRTARVLFYWSMLTIKTTG